MGEVYSGLIDNIYFFIHEVLYQKLQSKKKKIQHNSEVNIINYGVKILFLM